MCLDKLESTLTLSVLLCHWSEHFSSWLLPLVATARVDLEHFFFVLFHFAKSYRILARYLQNAEGFLFCFFFRNALT